MLETEKRSILERVATGQLDPAEAARLLETVEAGQSEGPGSVGPYAEPASAEQAVSSSASAGEHGRPAGAVTAPPITRVHVRGTSRRIRIIGDLGVATASVDGPHTIRREGQTLHVTGESEAVPTDGAFMLLTGGRWREVAERFQNVRQDLELRVRVNPELAVAAEAIAGSLQADNVPVLDHVRMTAGSLRVRGLHSPVDLLVQAGSAQIETRQLAGHSRMRCESGSLQLTLAAGSDVRVRPDVQLGRFTTEPERRAGDRDRDVVLGTGAAEIDAEVVMGNMLVRLPESGLNGSVA